MGRKRRLLALLSCAILVTAGSAGFLLASEREGDEDRGDREGSDLMEVLEVVTQGFVAPADAVTKALAATPGKAADVELTVHRTKDHRVVAWEVEVLVEKGMRHVYVDAAKGIVLATEEEDEEDEIREAAGLRELLGDNPVGLAAALATVGKAAEGVILAAELEEEDDAAAWSILVSHDGRPAELTVSAKSGKILPGDDGEDDDHEGGDDDGGDEDD